MGGTGFSGWAACGSRAAKRRPLPASQRALLSTSALAGGALRGLVMAAGAALVANPASAQDYSAGGGVINPPSGEATAVGSGATTTGTAASAYGFNSNANGTFASAFGAGANANGADATATGFTANANGASASAFGQGANANGQFDHRATRRRCRTSTAARPTATGAGSFANGARRRRTCSRHRQRLRTPRPSAAVAVANGDFAGVAQRQYRQWLQRHGDRR